MRLENGAAVQLGRGAVLADESALVWRTPTVCFLGSSQVAPGALPFAPDLDVLICGLPFDLGASFRAGAAGGPAAVRRASLALEEYSLAAGRDLKSLRIGDAGDLEVVGSGTGRAGERLAGPLESACRRCLKAGGMLVALGGDHSVSAAAAAAMQRWLAASPPAGSAGELSVLVLDAHADLRELYDGSRWSHACASARLLELAGPGRLQQAGVRSADRAEVDAAARAGLEWAARAAAGRLYLESRTLAEQATAALDALPAAGPLYLSVDLDVADPGCAPGVGAPEPGGPAAADVLAAVVAIARQAGRRLAGLDVVEVTPCVDPAGITAALAAKVVRDAILARTAG
jgi:agmatinase